MTLCINELSRAWRSSPHPASHAPNFVDRRAAQGFPPLFRVLQYSVLFPPFAELSFFVLKHASICYVGPRSIPVLEIRFTGHK
jgi:hypothetical protein